MGEHEAWQAGFKAGRDHERRLWQWQAGELSRAVNGLTVRPVEPENPYREDHDYAEVFEGADGKWRYRVKAGNHEIIAQSEAYASRSNALRAAESRGIRVTVLDD